MASSIRMAAVWIPLITMALLLITVDGSAKNILFLVADDMRPQLGAYYGRDFPSPVHPKMITPNLDALAKRSLLLRRSYTHQAVCGPSRTALLTGRRPDTTHVYDCDTYWRKSGGNFTTIPQYFKNNGYHTVGMGKVFHPGDASGNDDPISWSEPYFHATNPFPGDAHSWLAVNQSMKAKHGKLEDEQLADHAVETLKRMAQKTKNDGQPFFVAVGFHKPHLPFVFSEEFLELYPESSIRLPDNQFAPVDMPEVAWQSYRELRKYGDIKRLNASGAINTTLPKDVVLALRRAYYAATSYTDSLIGEVLKALDKLELTNNTIVSFFGDHGWQLGEHGEWAKHTNFELAVHAPVMIHMPGATEKGVQTDALTEFTDLFPTLVELAALPKVPLCPEDSKHISVCTEGASMVPLIKMPKMNWKPRVFSQYPRWEGKVMGYTMRTDRYRYTEWARFRPSPVYAPDWSQIVGYEFYDHETDPEENVNRVHDPSVKDLVKEFSNKLHKGWRDALPPSAGSANIDIIESVANLAQGKDFM